MNGNKYLSTLINRGDSSLIDQRYINKQTSFIPLEKDYVLVGTNRFPSRVIVTDSVFFQLFRYPVVGIFIYVIAILVVAGISLGTLLWQVNKAAWINPATIMKVE